MDIVFGWGLDGVCRPVAANGGDGGLGQPVLGPVGLLGLLETQLGLNGPSVPAAVRIARYQAKMRALDGGSRFYSASFSRDSWSTARQVLAWRDRLFAEGWNGRIVAGGGDRLDTIAKLESTEGHPIGPSLGERLQAVLGTFNDIGVNVGFQSIKLATPEHVLPPLWQELLTRLKKVGTAVEALPVRPAAKDCDLAVVQAALAGGTAHELRGDGSFVVFDAEDEWQAADVVSGWLASGPNEGLVLVRGEGSPALDSACRRLGLPRPGWDGESPHRGALQVLPLAIEILWEPLNVARLLEFLTLAQGPLPRFVARRFARALMKVPGTGGEEWNAAWQDCLANKAKWSASDGLDAGAIAKEEEKAEESWRAWLQPRRFQPEDGLPVPVIQDVCRRVAQWAAILGQRDGDRLFQTAAAQASALAEAVASVGIPAIPSVQLSRIVDAITAEGEAASVGGGEAAPWLTVDGPSRIWAEAETVIWWNFAGGAVGAQHPPWSAAEQAALAAEGVRVEPVESGVLREAASWKNAIVNARSRLILVKPRRHGGESVAAHPLWHELHARLGAKGFLGAAIVPAERVGAGDEVELAGRIIRRRGISGQELPESSRTHAIPSGKVGRRKIESISSIKNLIECPGAWTLNYGAHIREGALAVLPDDNTLIGTLAHAVIETLFSVRKDWRPDEAAAEASRLFDALAPAIAAPLLRPGFGAEYRRAKTRVAGSVRMLVGMIAEAGLKVRGCEEDVTAPLAEGQTMRGYLDLVLIDERGRSAIIDLKWSKRDKYREKEMRENRCLQLAAYAWLEEKTGRRVAGAGYFMLNQQGLLFSEPEPFPSESYISGADLKNLWIETYAAYEKRMGEVEAGALLFRGVEWDGKNPDPDDPMPRIEPGCRFCEYRVLCGAEIEGGRK